MEDYESIGHIMKHEEIDFLWFGNAKENPCDMFQTKNNVTVEDSNWMGATRSTLVFQAMRSSAQAADADPMDRETLISAVEPMKLWLSESSE